MISIEELKQRKIGQWTLAYLAGAWLLMQLAQWLADAYSWPNIILRLLPVVLGIGLLLVLVLAWYHGEEGRQRVSAPELLMIAGILVVAAVGVTAVRKGGHDTKQADGDVASAAIKVEQGSIAVLPFSDLSAKKDQAFFSDGLAEELLNVLAQIPALRVAARTSSFAFRDKNVGIDSIGRALHVEYVLEGSVRSAGERVRITAQLINAASGFHQWSETYDRDVKDIFAVQDEISKAIVQALRLKLESGNAAEPLARAGTQNPEAHELVLKGNYLLSQRTVEAVKLAEKSFRSAIALDPKYAEAQAALATALSYQAYRRYIPADKGYEDARAAAQKSLDLNADQAEAHMVLGRILDLHDWKFEDAERSFKRAIELNPALADAHIYRSWLLMRLGRVDESLSEAKRAVQLNPIAQNAYNTLGSMYSYVHRVPEAIVAYRKALETAPNPDIIEANLMLTYADGHQFDEATKLADKLRLRAPEDDIFALASAAYVYSHTGRMKDAEAVIAQVAKVPQISPYLLATAKVGVAGKDELFKLLEQAVAERDDYVPDLGVDPVFDSLRDDPRMAVLLKKIGLPTRK